MQINSNFCFGMCMHEMAVIPLTYLPRRKGFYTHTRSASHDWDHQFVWQTPTQLDCSFLWSHSSSCGGKILFIELFCINIHLICGGFIHRILPILPSYTFSIFANREVALPAGNTDDIPARLHCVLLQWPSEVNNFLGCWFFYSPDALSASERGDKYNMYASSWRSDIDHGWHRFDVMGLVYIYEAQRAVIKISFSCAPWFDHSNFYKHTRRSAGRPTKERKAPVYIIKLSDSITNTVCNASIQYRRRQIKLPLRWSCDKSYERLLRFGVYVWPRGRLHNNDSPFQRALMDHY